MRVSWINLVYIFLIAFVFIFPVIGIDNDEIDAIENRTLAKAPKIETIWLSNQGAIGKYDTIASRIGASADKQYFIKKAGYNTSGETDDLELLPLFQNELKILANLVYSKSNS